MTAWTQAGSLTSDRIQPRQRPAPQQNQRSKVKHTQSDLTHPKSKEVQKLELILQGLRRERDTSDPAGGCFCQARSHSLSKYTPNCLNCGFVLCALHLPFHLCPHCSKSLVDFSSRSALISRVEEELNQRLQKEEDDRIREQQEREQAQGAFPTLAAAAGTAEPRMSAQPRSVLSLNSKTGKAVMSTYSAPHTLTRMPPGQTPEKEVREPRPPSDADYVKGKTLEPASWKNLRDESVIYVAPFSSNEDPGSVRSKKPKKKT